jgi:hypothetical protein
MEPDSLPSGASLLSPTDAFSNGLFASRSQSLALSRPAKSISNANAITDESGLSPNFRSEVFCFRGCLSYLGHYNQIV